MYVQVVFCVCAPSLTAYTVKRSCGLVLDALLRLLPLEKLVQTIPALLQRTDNIVGCSQNDLSFS